MRDKSRYPTTIEPANSVTFEETEITFNGDLVPLKNEEEGYDNEYVIEAEGEDGDTVLTELVPESSQGGFLIMDIEYELEDGSIVTGTYAITIPGGGNGNGNGGGN